MLQDITKCYTFISNELPIEIWTDTRWNCRSNTIYQLRYENGIAADNFVYSRLLKKGMQGADIQNLQEVLKRLGHLPISLQTTQYFGNQTYSGVLSFQKQFGLTMDGIVGPATANAINKVLANSGSSRGTGSSRNNDQVYTVRAGDTLWSLSQKYNLSVKQLQQTNGLNGTTIYVGQKLTIPTDTIAPGESNTEPKQSVTVTYHNYNVKAGDSIRSLHAIIVFRRMS